MTFHADRTAGTSPDYALVTSNLLKPGGRIAATVSLNGLLDRRWSFQAAGGAALGNLGFGSSSNGFNTYYATAGVSRALSRFVNLGVDYSFYRYDFEQADLLPQGYNTDFSRNTVRATLSAWLPLFQRGRRSNASR